MIFIISEINMEPISSNGRELPYLPPVAKGEKKIIQFLVNSVLKNVAIDEVKLAQQPKEIKIKGIISKYVQLNAQDSQGKIYHVTVKLSDLAQRLGKTEEELKKAVKDKKNIFESTKLEVKSESKKMLSTLSDEPEVRTADNLLPYENLPEDLSQETESTIQETSFLDKPERRTTDTLPPLETLPEEEAFEVRTTQSELLPLETLPPQTLEVRGYIDPRLTAAITQISEERLAEVNSAFAPSEIKEATFHLTAKLGEGGNNAVFEAIIQHVGEETVAFIQPLESKPLSQDEKRRHLLSIMNDLRGLPNVGEIKAVVWKNPPEGSQLDKRELLGFMMEKMDSDLAVYLSVRKPTFGEKKEIIKGISTGISALHAKDIVHRDLKPGNILFKKGVPYIIDHELSLKLRKNFEGFEESIKADHLTVESATGTLEFLPPDLIGYGYRETPLEEFRENVILQRDLANYETNQMSKGEIPTAYRWKSQDRYDAGLIFYEILTGEKVPWLADLQNNRLSDAQKYKFLTINHRDMKNGDQFVYRDRLMQKLAEAGPNNSIKYVEGRLIRVMGLKNEHREEAQDYINLCHFIFELLDPDPRNRPMLADKRLASVESWR